MKQKFLPFARLRDDGSWYVSYRILNDLLFAVDVDADERGSAEFAGSFAAAAWLTRKYEMERNSGKSLNTLRLPDSFGFQPI